MWQQNNSLFCLIIHKARPETVSMGHLFMPALALAIDTDDGGATDQLMAESRSD